MLKNLFSAMKNLFIIIYLLFASQAYAQVSHTIVDTDSTQTLMSKTIGGNSTTTANVDIITKGPWVDVRAYGAKGDGVTDDTAAIQAAINAGKWILIPDNLNFKTTATLTYAFAGQHIEGLGKTSRTNQGLAWNTTSLVNGSQTVTFSSTSIYSSSTSYTLFATTESVGGTVSVIQNSGTSATIKGANTEKVHWYTIGN